jgi:hypothetical protein
LTLLKRPVRETITGGDLLRAIVNSMARALATRQIAVGANDDPPIASRGGVPKKISRPIVIQ